MWGRCFQISASRSELVCAFHDMSGLLSGLLLDFFWVWRGVWKLVVVCRLLLMVFHLVGFVYEWFRG